MKTQNCSKFLLIIFLIANLTIQTEDDIKFIDTVKGLVMNGIKSNLSEFIKEDIPKDETKIQVGSETINITVNEIKDKKDKLSELKIKLSTEDVSKKYKSFVETELNLQKIEIGTRSHVADFIQKVVRNFCMKIVQNNTEIKPIDEDIMKLFNVIFREDKIEFADGVNKIDGSKFAGSNTFVPDQNMLEYAIHYGSDNERKYQPVNFFISKNEESNDNLLKYNIDVSNPKYDRIFLEVKREVIDGESDKITILVTSNYFTFEYILSFITKRFIIKMIEGIFIKIRDKIFKNLDQLDRRTSPEQFESQLSHYIRLHTSLFKQNLEQSTNIGNCNYNFSFEQNGNNMRIKFFYDPVSVISAQNNTPTEIVKTFPLNSLYNIYTFPVLFIEGIINMLTVITTIGVPAESQQTGMINPYIEFLEEDNGELRTFKLQNKKPGDNYLPELSVVILKSPSDSDTDDNVSKMKIIDYVFKKVVQRKVMRKKLLL